MPRKYLLAVALFVASAVAVGCGGEDTGPKPGAQPNDKQSSKEKMRHGVGDSAIPKGKE